MATATEHKSEAAVQDYIDGVKSGEIIAGQYVKWAVLRHERDLEEQEALGIYFDSDAAQLAINVIESLEHWKGEWAGEPFILEPWELFLTWSVFGWKWEKDNHRNRRFKQAYIEVARKNGKSMWASAVGIFLFVFDNEPGAEVYCAATKKDQAKIVHENALRMVARSPMLNRVVKSLKGNMSIASTGSKFEPIGRDADSTDGLNISGAIVDEVHAHKTRDLWDVIETATGARRQPLLIPITTAGSGSDHESICRELHDYAVKILDPSREEEDDTVFAFIATIDEGDDWTDEACWVKANPNLGISVKIDDLRAKCKKAIETPAAANNFRRKHCNEWTETTTAWLPAGLWDTCDREPEEIDGQDVWLGLDLATVNDLAALAAVWWDDDQVLNIRVWFFCPAENAAKREKQHAVPYLTWAKQGFIEMTNGNSIDYRAIRHRINELSKQCLVRTIGFDPYNATHLITELTDEDGFDTVLVRQGALSMSPPTKELQRMLLDGKVRHGGNRVLRWCVGNAAVTMDKNENLHLDKEQSADKIDGIIATIIALSQGMAEGGAGASVYEDGGARFL